MVDRKLEREIGFLHERICSGFAESSRVLMLYALSYKQLRQHQLTETLGLAQSTTSRHLRVLRERGLVHAERKGTSVYYSLADRRLIQALDLLRAVLASQLAADADLARSLS